MRGKGLTAVHEDPDEAAKRALLLLERRREKLEKKLAGVPPYGRLTAGAREHVEAELELIERAEAVHWQQLKPELIGSPWGRTATPSRSTRTS
jgi:hypothetical protein